MIKRCVSVLVGFNNMTCYKCNKQLTKGEIDFYERYHFGSQKPQCYRCSQNALNDTFNLVSPCDVCSVDVGKEENGLILCTKGHIIEKAIYNDPLGFNEFQEISI